MNQNSFLHYLFHRNRLALHIVGLILLFVSSFRINAYAQFGTTLREGDKLDAVIAIVGKYPIYKSTIDGKLQLLLYQRQIATLPDDSLMIMRKQILENEIDQKVLLARADQDSLTVTEAEIDERIDQQVAMIERQLGSAEAVEKQFGKTIPELKASPEYRENFREGILVEKEREKSFPSSQSISRHDVEKFFTLYRDSLPEVSQEAQLATIIKYVKVLPNQKERSRAFAEALVDSLKHGANFGALARRYSQHISAKDSGDLGAFYARGTFVAEYEEAAFKLKPGEFSDVVTTDQGFFIIKMIERRGEEIHVAEILIKPNASTADEEVVRNEILKIRDSAMNGVDFSKLATNNSDDPETKMNGGDLGALRVEDLQPEQREVVDSLTPGEISMPLHIQLSKTVTGFQIVKLVKKIAPHKPTLATDYREIEAYAMQWKQSRDFEGFIKKARAGVYVEVRDIKQFY